MSRKCYEIVELIVEWPSLNLRKNGLEKEIFLRKPELGSIINFKTKDLKGQSFKIIFEDL